MPRIGAGGRLGRAFLPALVLTLLAVCGSLAADRDGSPPRFKGLLLSEALQRLQHDGLNVIYSSDLVRPDMRVTEEPRGRWPHELLDELLAPHGLRSKPGPAGTVLVVKAPQRTDDGRQREGSSART